MSIFASLWVKLLCHWAGQYLWVMEDPSHDQTPLRSLIGLSNISVPAFPPRGLRRWPSCRSFIPAHVRKNAASDLTDEAAPTVRLWGSQRVLLQSILLPWRHSRPQRSCPKFLLLQPTAWMLCFLGDKGSLPRKVTQQSSTHSLSWDKSCLQGLGTVGYWDKQPQEEKTVEYNLLILGKLGLTWQSALIHTVQWAGESTLIVQTLSWNAVITAKIHSSRYTYEIIMTERIGKWEVTYFSQTGGVTHYLFKMSININPQFLFFFFK